MAAFLKDDCEDDYIVHAIDKAAKHLGYDKITKTVNDQHMFFPHKNYMFTNFN